MKASRIMLLEYVTMVGVPLLLIVSIILIPLHGIELLKRALLFLIAIGSVIYGAIGVKDVYVKGGEKNGSKN